MNQMPPTVEMDVVVGPEAEGARRATGSLRAYDDVTRARPRS